MYLVLVRHGESVWNKENRFTGWTDVELSFKGREEADSIGGKLNELQIDFSVAFTSVLKRAEDTLDIILKKLNKEDIKIKRTYKLNERHYGALQGLNKEETKERYGEEQVFKWRRSYTERPPELEITDARFPGNDEKYKNILKFDLPMSESLKDTYDRVVPYYEDEITTYLSVDENVLVVAHGNSLRALVKYLEKINDEDISEIEIPTAAAIVYELDEKLQIVNKEIITC